MIEYDKEFWNACDRLISSSEIVIDRPRNSCHPRFSDMIYPVDYGYLKDTASMDGGGIDVWLGTDSKKKLDAIICIVDLLKRDSEIKLLIGCTEDEKQTVLNFHNSSELMKGIIILRNK